MFDQILDELSNMSEHALQDVADRQFGVWNAHEYTHSELVDLVYSMEIENSFK